MQDLTFCMCSTMQYEQGKVVEVTTQTKTKHVMQELSSKFKTNVILDDDDS